MKSLKASILLLTILIASVTFGLEASGKIEWTTDYSSAVSRAKTENKPILLFFTGSDWCGWCKKLESEVFNTSSFANEMGDKLVFVELDYPMSKGIDPNTKQQNDRLKQKYQINGYPTVIVIDQNEKMLGRTGYKAGGGSAYANHLRAMMR